ncbi:MAG: hypothetical protein U1F48_09145 [Burkholderiales bacterium]
MFEGRERGCRALARLLDDGPARPAAIELVALAVPRVPGRVRMHLGTDAAIELATAAARSALAELGDTLARDGIAYRTRIEVGTLRQALQAALAGDDADAHVVAIGLQRWIVALLARRAFARPPRNDRVIVA